MRTFVIYERVCPYCGKEFKTWKANKFYCSRFCSNELHKQKLRNDYESSVEGLHEIRACEVCGEQFVAKSYRSKYCSRKCGLIASNIRNGYCNYQSSEETHICKQCGEEFKTKRKDALFCSEKCYKKYRYDLYHGCGSDKDITLERLIEREGNICHICGKECNHDDYEIKDGYKVCGRMYPSVDHVVPVSKNGLHTWENVRLAHIGCNSMKGCIEAENIRI